MLLAENISIISRYYANAQTLKKEDIRFSAQVSKVESNKQNKHRVPCPLNGQTTLLYSISGWKMTACMTFFKKKVNDKNYA